MFAIGADLSKKVFNKIVSFTVLPAVAVFCFFAFYSPTVLAQAPSSDAGYRDFNFGTVSTSEPTSEKPQSKLWWNDGLWWGSLWNPSTNRYEIYRFDLAAQNWITTGTAIDTRSSSKADALWDGQYLYVASMRYASVGGPTTATNSARLYRFSYNSSTKIYTLDSGFPVNVNGSQSETLALDKDSSGRLWITWVESGKVMVNRSTGSDLIWGTPFILPAQGNDVNADDISTLVAFGGNKIGVLWSNQNDSTTYFAVHADGDADEVWQPREIALRDPQLGAVAEDHLNLKASGDGSGAIYATTVSNLSGANPGVFVLKRDAFGAWTRSVFSPANLGHTRPILLINHANQRLHVFARSTETGPGFLYTKSASLDDLVFPPGLGTPIIQNATDTNINNPTSSKQFVNNSTGLLVLASDKTTRYYLHNHIDFSTDGAIITAFSPSSGPVGTQVTITGENLSSTTHVAFSGVTATSFAIDADTQLRATVPAGASNGKISITNAVNTGISDTDFLLTAPPIVAFFNPSSGPAGATVTIAGNHFASVTSVTFNGTSAASFMVDSDTQLRAIVPAEATSGKINVANADGAGLSANDFIITLPPEIASFTPASGVAGTVITIGGGNFTGVSAVTFNGTSASFVFDSDTQLSATLPSGASTGKISVANSAGAGLSATDFVVRQILNVNIVGSGSVILDPPGGVYDQGTTVTATAIPDANWEFNDWDDDLDGAPNPAALFMNSNKNIQATFTAIPQYTVTTTVVGAGAVALDPPGGVYYRDTIVTLTSTSDPGYVFSGWSGDFKGWMNVEQMTITSNKNLTATFSPLPAPIASGILTNAGELSILPTAGMTWERMKFFADAPIGPPNLSDQDDSVNVRILAKALVYARTGQASYRNDVIAACMAAIGTEQGPDGRTLALGRELMAYVVAADLVGLPPAEDAAFRSWLGAVLSEVFEGLTLRTAHEVRANNWGTQCGASRAAIARYLGDATELERTARVFKGWLGDRNTYAGFSFDELDWQANQAAPVGINPQGAMLNGHSVDGVLPDDQRRSGGFSWPPPKEDYVYGALQGALTQAIILHRAGYDVWNWENQALRRAVKWLYHEANYLPDGDDEWVTHIVNHFYDENLPAPFPANAGKNAGWTDWLYGGQFSLTMQEIGDGDFEIHALGDDENDLAALKISAMPDVGAQFISWSGSLSGAENPDTLKMDSDKNVTVNFSDEGEYVLRVMKVGQGNVAVNPPSLSVDPGTVVTLTALPVAGFQFSGWSGDLTGSANPTTILMDSDKTVTAIFTSTSTPQHLLTVNTVGSGSVTLNPPGGVYDASTVVTLTANPASGFQFSNWSGDLTGSANPTTSTMDAAKSVTATFVAIQYALTVNTVGSGSVSLNPPGGVYDSGTVVTLTANPSSGFQFTNWSGDLTGSANPATITMDAAKSVTATFVAIQYALTVSTVGSGSVSLNPPGGVYDAGTVVTLTANPASGFQFNAWSGDLIGSSNPATITVDANKNVTATFAEIISVVVTHEETKTGGSSSSTTVATSTSLTGASNHLYLAAISSRPKVTVTAVSGFGLTWTLVKAQCSGRNLTGIELWMAHGAPTGNGAVTATLSSAPTNAAIAVSRYSGVATANPVGNVASANTKGVNGICSGGSDTKVYSFNLTTTVDGAVAYGAVGMRNRTHTPGAGYTERAEIIQGTVTGSMASVAVEDKTISPPATVAVNGSFSATIDWAAVAVEIKPHASGAPAQYTLNVNTTGSGTVSMNPPGGIYNAGTIVTLTANAASGFEFSGWSGELSGSTNPTTIAMNSNKSVTATFTQLPSTQYTLTTNANGSGSIALNPPGGIYNAGEMVTATANATSGFQFSGWSGDASGVTNPTTMTMNANKSITATFTPISGGGGPVTHEETKTGGATSSTAVTTSASLGAVSGHLYLAAIASKPKGTVTSVSGLGLSWTLVKAQCSGRNATGIELWMAQGAPAGSGVVMATFSSAPTNAVIVVSRYSGVADANPVGNVVSGNTRGVNGACSGGTDNSSYSFSLPVTMNGAMAYGAATMRSRTHTPGAGFTEEAELLQGSGGDVASIAVEDQSGASAATVTVNGSFSGSTDWAVVAVEIKPQATATFVDQNTIIDEKNSAVQSGPIDEFSLEQNYPNPFNAESIIEYALPTEAAARLRIYNTFGQLVRTLVDETQPAGRYRIIWNGRDDESREVGAGVYLLRLEAGSQTLMRKMTVIK